MNDFGKVDVVRCGDCILCNKLCPMWNTMQGGQWTEDFCSFGVRHTTKCEDCKVYIDKRCTNPYFCKNKSVMGFVDRT
jgi:hypothetical protein